MKPEDVKKALAYSKLKDASKASFAFVYNYFCQVNELKWERPKYDVRNPTPIIPTTNQVEKIISASTFRFATIFTLMKEIGVEGEELHQTHRRQFDPTTRALAIVGLKKHDSKTYTLKPEIANMLTEYLAKDPREYPFPQPKTMSKMWRRARETASKKNADKTLLIIPMKNLRNYSGAQYYLKSEHDSIGTMRHMRHRKWDTTLRYLRGINLEEEPEYESRIAETPEEAMKLINCGYIKADEWDGKHIYRKRK
jgi:hypothetical protein